MRYPKATSGYISMKSQQINSILGLLIACTVVPMLRADAPMCHMDSANSSAAGPVTSQNSPESLDLHPPVEASNITLTNGEQAKVVIFKDILIDRPYATMTGPWAKSTFSLNTDSTGKPLWLTGYKAEILDSDSGQAAPQFLCHTNMSMGSPQFSLAQGHTEIQFPKGYAIPVSPSVFPSSYIQTRFLNLDPEVTRKKLNFKGTITYIDDATARAQHITPLSVSGTGTSCLATPDAKHSDTTVCEPVDSKMVVNNRTTYWYVPPGRHPYISPVARGLGFPYDTTIHYLVMHVHPYAESVELRDLTTGKSVWKGLIKNDLPKGRILSTDFYSSAKGLKIYRDHSYQFISTYNNPTDHKIDAMAILYIYTSH